MTFKYGEPWTGDKTFAARILEDGSRLHLFEGDPEAVERAVACVNAMAGVGVEAIISKQPGTVRRMLKDATAVAEALLDGESPDHKLVWNLYKTLVMFWVE